MENKKPVYKQIAIDLANKISSGYYNENEKIVGSSTLSSLYNVSPETVRRAITLLSEAGVVTAKVGTGIIVVSAKAAEEFVNKNKDLDAIDTVKKNIYNLIEQQRENNEKLFSYIDVLIDANERFNYLNPLTPFEIEIREHSHLVDKTLKHTHFWNNTGATVIAITRQGKVILSPGPKTVLKMNDRLLIVGEEEHYKRAVMFAKLTKEQFEEQKNNDK